MAGPPAPTCRPASSTGRRRPRRTPWCKRPAEPERPRSCVPQQDRAGSDEPDQNRDVPGLILGVEHRERVRLEDPLPQQDVAERVEAKGDEKRDQDVPPSAHSRGVWSGP